MPKETMSADDVEDNASPIIANTGGKVMSDLAGTENAMDGTITAYATHGSVIHQAESKGKTAMAPAKMLNKKTKSKLIDRVPPNNLSPDGRQVYL